MSQGHAQPDVIVRKIVDEYGFEVENTPFGDLRVIEPMRLVGTIFDGTTVDTNFWQSTVANAATITQANSQVTLTSGTNAAGSAQFNSIRRARYVGGSSMNLRIAAQVDNTGIANNTRRWGIAFGATMPTITDGAWFQISGTTFSIVTFKTGGATTVSSGSFNGKFGPTYALDTNVHMYEIYWTTTDVYFTIDGVLLHTVAALSATWADTLSHYVYLSNINSGNTTSVVLECRIAVVRRFGPMLTQPISKYQSGTVAALVLKNGPGNVHQLLVSGVANNSVITLYDNTAASGTILFSTGAMTANTVPFAMDLDAAPFSIGLTLAITAANSNATVVYE